MDKISDRDCDNQRNVVDASHTRCPVGAQRRFGSHLKLRRSQVRITNNSLWQRDGSMCIPMMWPGSFHAGPFKRLRTSAPIDVADVDNDGIPEVIVATASGATPMCTI